MGVKAKLLIWLGNRGWFKYEGGIWRCPRGFPLGRVVYHDGRSNIMPLGNACDLAAICGGYVELVEREKNQ